MNGRILVLLGALGLFVAAWNGGAQRSTSVTNIVRSKVIAQRVPTLPVAEVVIDRRSVAWEGVAPEITIPQELAPGRYRVVSDRGDVAALIVSDSGAAPKCTPALAVQTAGPVRWYFIRLQTGSSSVTAHNWSPEKNSGLAIQTSGASAEDPADPADNSPPVAKTNTAETVAARSTAWNSKERDILLARARGWLIAINEALQSRLHPQLAKVQPPAVQAVADVAAMAQVENDEPGVVPEFNDAAELPDLPDFAELPELLEIPAEL